MFYLNSSFGISHIHKTEWSWNKKFFFFFFFLSTFRPNMCLKIQTVWKPNSYWVSKIHISLDCRDLMHSAKKSFFTILSNEASSKNWENCQRLWTALAPKWERQISCFWESQKLIWLIFFSFIFSFNYLSFSWINSQQQLFYTIIENGQLMFLIQYRV